MLISQILPKSVNIAIFEEFKQKSCVHLRIE